MHLSLFLILSSVVALGGAYTSQYAFGFEPCILCLYQRWPYFVVIVLGAISLVVKGWARLALIAACSVAFFVGAGVAFYHVNVEQGNIVLEEGCTVGDEIPTTLEEVTMQLMGKPHVPCDKPQVVFLGISMAGWNFFYSAFLGLMTATRCIREYKARRKKA